MNGTILKYLRLYHDMTRKELADKLDLGSIDVAYIENNHKKSRLSVPIIWKYAKIFKVDKNLLRWLCKEECRKTKIEKIVINGVLKFLGWIHEKSII